MDNKLLRNQKNPRYRYATRAKGVSLTAQLHARFSLRNQQLYRQHLSSYLIYIIRNAQVKTSFKGGEIIKLVAKS